MSPSRLSLEKLTLGVGTKFAHRLLDINLILNSWQITYSAGDKRRDGWSCVATKFLEHSVEMTFWNQEENLAGLKFWVFNESESSLKLLRFILSLTEHTYRRVFSRETILTERFSETNLTDLGENPSKAICRRVMADNQHKASLQKPELTFNCHICE